MATVIGAALAVILGGAGLAGAANGGTFILGRSGHESGRATLSNSRGTALSLSAPGGTAPLKVNRSTEVKNLNADYVGGLSAAGLKLTGGTGYAPVNADIALGHDQPVNVAGTGSVPAGTYYVRASALADLTVGDTGAFCFLEEDNDSTVLYGGGGGDGENYVEAIETLVLKLAKPGSFQEYCLAAGSGDGTEVIDAGIIAIKIVSSSGPVSGGSLAVHR